jgi:hypothetical protein
MFVQVYGISWQHTRYIAAADIRMVRRDEDDWTVETKDGTTYRISDIEARVLVDERLPVVPAGHHINACVLLMLVPDHTVIVRQTRVIGWRLVSNDDALPIFADTSTDDTDRLTLIEMPDGRWHSTDNMEVFDTLDNAKEVFKADWLDRDALKKKSASA